VKEPWSYQNGGQWDWFGGRLVLAEMQSGRAARGREHLMSLALKAQRSGGLFEWHTRDGQGRGSGRYAGSAGALGAALIEGLLGVELYAAEAILSPRLGPLGATAHLVEPGTGSIVDYDYRPAANDLTFAFEVRPARPTRARVLLPPGWGSIEVRLDGQLRPATMDLVGTDLYAPIDVGPGAHRLALRKAVLRRQAAPVSRP
jgi:hypothetical protein